MPNNSVNNINTRKTKPNNLNKIILNNINNNNVNCNENEIIEMMPKNRVSYISRNNSENNVRQRKTKQIKVSKYMTTFILYFCSFIYGTATHLNSLTILEFQQMLNIPFQRIYVLHTIYSISFIIGCIFSVLAFKPFTRHICTAICLILIGVSDASIPNSPHIWVSYILSVIKGVSSGVMNISILVWIIEIWKHKSGPYIHSLLFFISLGSFLTPIISKQYLINDINNNCNPINVIQTLVQNNNQQLLNDYYPKMYASYENFTNHSNDNFYGITVKSNLTKSIESIEKPIAMCDKYSLLTIPYVCEGFLSICASILLIIILIDENHNRNRKGFKIKKRFSDTESIASVKSWRKYFFVLIGSILLSCYMLIEFTNFQLLAENLILSELKYIGSDSSIILIALFGSFTIFRFISIFIALKLKPQIMLIINFVLILIANVIIVFYGNNSFIINIIASILLGSGLSSIIPSIYSLLEQYIHLNNNISPIIIFMGGLMSIINTEIFGRFIGQNSLFYIIINLFSIIIAIVMVVIISYSKCLVSTGSFTLKSVQSFNYALNDDEFESENNDTIISTTSIRYRHSAENNYYDN